jgi:hypothetical protein
MPKCGFSKCNTFSPVTVPSEMILHEYLGNMALRLFQFLSRYQSPYLLIKFCALLLDDVPNLCTILWELKVYLATFLLDSKLMVKIIFGAKIMLIIAREHLKLSVLAKYFDIIRIGFDLFIKTRDLLSVFIDRSTVNVQLVNVFWFLWNSPKVEKVYSGPSYILWKTIVELSDYFAKLLLVTGNILWNDFNVVIDSFFDLKFKLNLKWPFFIRPILSIG